jgi:hypothetical protein
LIFVTIVPFLHLLIPTSAPRRAPAQAQAAIASLPGDEFHGLQEVKNQPTCLLTSCSLFVLMQAMLRNTPCCPKTCPLR